MTGELRNAATNGKDTMYDVVIIGAGPTGLFASFYAGMRGMRTLILDALPEPGGRALDKLIERKAPLVGISFGNPYLLMNFPDLKTYMIAYGDMPSLQRAAARALLGEIDVTGRLPISLPQLYARGTGIQLKAQARAQAETKANTATSK